MNFYNILPLITSILYLQAGIFVVALGHRSKPHVFFALLSLAFATYAFGSACYIGADSLRHAAFWYRLATPGMRLYPILTLLFFLSLAGETPSVFIRFLSRPAVLVLLFIPPLILITATFLDPDYFSGFRRFEAGWLNESFPSSGLSLLYLSYLVGYFILSNLVLVLWRRYTDSMRISRQSALIQAFSIIMFCLALFTSVVLPHLAPRGHTPRLISSVPVIWLAGIVYTILRHRLFLYQADSSRRLLDSLEGMLVVTDTDLRIVSVNPAAAGIMKSSPSDLRGKKLPDILSFSDEEAVRLSGFTAGEITRVTLFPELGTDRLTVDLTAIQDDAGAPLLYLISLRQATPGPDIFSGSGLTKREQEIIRLLLKGKTNPQIADELCISLATVKTHLFKAFRKLGVDNRHEIFSLLSADPR